jgi:hypothetical protein
MLLRIGEVVLALDLSEAIEDAADGTPETVDRALGAGEP